MSCFPGCAVAGWLRALAACLILSGPVVAWVDTPRGSSPQEERASFRFDDGLEVELVAAEPLIESPVAIAFDENGRLWVVEMLDYPNGPAPGQPPAGRIKVLDDPDGDGRYDRATIFADGLLFANGLLPWKGGVVVTAAPEVLYLADDDHDGRADRRGPLYQGFKAENPQLRVSHPTIGIDGWVYVANGLRGGTVRRAGRADAPEIDLSGRDFRFDLVRDRAEAVAGMGQYGNTFDDWGHRYVCTNRNHLVPIVFEDRYARRNPFLAAPGPRSDDQAAGGAARIFPISHNRTTSPLHTGSFSASCGVTIYRGSALPEFYRDNAFTCDPTGNLVHQERIEPDGAGFRGVRVHEGKEFLASSDDWFRPVFLAHGPDDAFYVVDMHRAVIEHPEWLPPEGRNPPDLIDGRETGRIWRIRPAGENRPRPSRPALGKASSRDLVSMLNQPNAWIRSTAQRLLLERNDPEAIPGLRELANNAQGPNGEPTDPRARALAAWLLDRLGKLDEAAIQVLLKADSPRLREQAVLLAEPRLKESGPLVQAVAGLASDPDPRVRFQVAASIGEAPGEAVIEPLATVARLGADDHWTRLAIVSAVPDRAGALIAALTAPGGAFVAETTPGRLAIVQELGAIVGARGDSDELGRLLGGLVDRGGPEMARWRFACLAGLADGIGRRGGRLAESLKAVPDGDGLAGRVDALLNAAAELASDSNAAAESRVEAIRLLGQGRWDQVGPALIQLVTDADADPPIRLAAARAIAEQPGAEPASKLLAGWKAYTPSVRREVAAALVSRAERAVVLLDAIEAKQVAPGEIDASLIQKLNASGHPKVRDRARKLLAAAVPEGRKVVLDRYQAALKNPGDPIRGREVFRKTCATCHVLEGFGTSVGPDIADTRVKSPEQLLNDILNPNAAIDANYTSYTVALRDGRVLSGIIAAETATGITLKRAEGQTDAVLRQDVEELHSDGVSLMPEGVEKDVSVEQMADLIAYLKTWRDLPAPASPR